MDERLIQLQKSLESKGYLVDVFANKEAARDFINSQLDGKVIGIGGSQTVKEMGLFEALSAHNEVYWHDNKPANLTVMETRQMAIKAPVYISSVNGISEDGVIVNIDFTGNRVAAISFGPEDVYLVIGTNKIAPTFNDALWRARNIASPLNAKRLNRKTPCAVNADKCYDCDCPDRICRNLSVLWTRPMGAKYHVVLIDEELGY